MLHISDSCFLHSMPPTQTTRPLRRDSNSWANTATWFSGECSPNAALGGQRDFVCIDSSQVSCLAITAVSARPGFLHSDCDGSDSHAGSVPSSQVMYAVAHRRVSNAELYENRVPES